MTIHERLVNINIGPFHFSLVGKARETGTNVEISRDSEINYYPIHGSLVPTRIVKFANVENKNEVSVYVATKTILGGEVISSTHIKTLKKQAINSPSGQSEVARKLVWKPDKS